VRWLDTRSVAQALDAHVMTVSVWRRDGKLHGR
jgi:hypothetical protein